MFLRHIKAADGHLLLCLGARMRTAAYGSLFVCQCVCVSVYYCYNCSTVEMQV